MLGDNVAKISKAAKYNYDLHHVETGKVGDVSDSVAAVAVAKYNFVVVADNGEFVAHRSVLSFIWGGDSPRLWVWVSGRMSKLSYARHAARCAPLR